LDKKFGRSVEMLSDADFATQHWGILGVHLFGAAREQPQLCLNTTPDVSIAAFGKQEPVVFAGYFRG
jgi:hypothetical protein